MVAELCKFAPLPLVERGARRAVAHRANVAGEGVAGHFGYLAQRGEVSRRSKVGGLVFRFGSKADIGRMSGMGGKRTRTPLKSVRVSGHVDVRVFPMVDPT